MERQWLEMTSGACPLQWHSYEEQLPKGRSTKMVILARPHPNLYTYLLQLVCLLVVPLQLLPQHVVLLGEHLYHLLRPLHDGKGVRCQLLARQRRGLGSCGGWQWGQGAWEQRASGGLRGHGAVLLGRRRREGRLALSAVESTHGPSVRAARPQNAYGSFHLMTVVY